MWNLELWEYNNFIAAKQDKQKNDIANAILIGYYSAYYTNGGKKAKNPNDLIKKLYIKKQDLTDGLRDIERLKKSERNKEMQ